MTVYIQDSEYLNTIGYDSIINHRIAKVFAAIDVGADGIPEVYNLLYLLIPEFKKEIEVSVKTFTDMYNMKVEELKKTECKAKTPNAKEYCHKRVLELSQQYSRNITHIVIGLLNKHNLLLKRDGYPIEIGGWKVKKE